MARTSRFKLTLFGGPLGGSITDDGGRFSSHDPQVVDNVLQAFENHVHRGGERLEDPSGPATVVLDTTTGALQANTSFFYRVAYRDQFGLETAACSEVVVTTPGPVYAPAAPRLVGAQRPTGNTAPGLRAGQYVYALTSYSGSIQSPLGQLGVITLSSDYPFVAAALPAAPAGATSIGVWRLGPGEIGYTQIATVDPSTTTLTDDGAVPADVGASNPATQPPTQNVTQSTNSATITVPDPSLVADPTKVSSWVVYRTTQSGVYQASSLVAEVVTPAEAPDTGLVLSYVDSGGAMSLGTPNEVSQTLTPTAEIPLNVVTVLPDPSTVLEGTPLVTPDGLLHVRVAGAWVTVGMFPMGATLPAATGLPDGYPFVLTASTPATLHVVQAGAWIAVGGAGGGGGSGVLISPSNRPFQLAVADDGTLSTVPIVGVPEIDVPVQVTVDGNLVVGWQRLTYDGVGYDPDNWTVELFVNTMPGAPLRLDSVASDSVPGWNSVASFSGLDPGEVGYEVHVKATIGSTDGAVVVQAILPGFAGLIGSSAGIGGVDVDLSGGTVAAPRPGDVTPSDTTVPGDGTVTVDWTDGDPVGDHWIIRVHDPADSSVVVDTQTATAHPYTVTGLTNGTTQLITVTPVNVDGVEGTETELQERTAGLIPANLTLTPSSGQLAWSFDAVPAASNYRMYWYDSTAHSGVTLQVTTNSGVRTGLINGHHYLVNVTAQDGSLNDISDNSDQVLGIPG